VRYLFGLMCVLALGVMPLVGCGEDGGGGEAEECADWVGDWTVGSISCDGVGVVGLDSGIDLRFAANCTGSVQSVLPLALSRQVSPLVLW
jgi:hypothetical protein